ncbi:MAG: pyridoxamine 5'-phosphate oxidase family protein [Rhizomicrobium sp.]
MSLDKNTLVAFIRQHHVGVVSTVGANRSPEAALVYLAATDDLELVFYALQDTRKCVNLRRDPRIAAVIGWDDKKSLQYEGVATSLRVWSWIASSACTRPRGPMPACKCNAWSHLFPRQAEMDTNEQLRPPLVC